MQRQALDDHVLDVDARDLPRAVEHVTALHWILRLAGEGDRIAGAIRKRHREHEPPVLGEWERLRPRRDRQPRADDADRFAPQREGRPRVAAAAVGYPRPPDATAVRPGAAVAGRTARAPSGAAVGLPRGPAGRPIHRKNQSQKSRAPPRRRPPPLAPPRDEPKSNCRTHSSLRRYSRDARTPNVDSESALLPSLPAGQREKARNIATAAATGSSGSSRSSPRGSGSRRARRCRRRRRRRSGCGRCSRR